MKKQNNSLSIQKNIAQEQIPAAMRLSALLPGSLLLTGFWGMLLQELQISAEGFFLVIPAIIVLLICLLLRWDKKWQVWTAIGALVAVCIVCLLLRSSLASGVAGVLEQIGNWWFLRTGKYTPGFEGAGNIWHVLCLLSVISGLVVAFLLRMKNPLVQVLLTVVVLLGWAAGLLAGGWWIALYLMGTLLTVAAYASGQGKSLTVSGVIALVLAAVIGLSFLLTGFTPQDTQLGSNLHKQLHGLRWEENGNPLPEGKLKDLGTYQPMEKNALEVTMQQWTPLYLRGFAAGRYTDSGWEPLGAETFAERAEDLYAMQSGYFLPVTQIYNASQEAGAITENSVVVKNVGACSAYAYIPYGAGSIAGNVLTPEDLRWEGTYAPKDRQYSAQLYSIDGSYLLQADLKETTDTPYRKAEGTYRAWVYENFVIIPQEVHDILSTYFVVDGEMTTVQAKREITKLLAEMVTYEENVLTSTGQRDFISYVLEVSKSGYSVHYATLATLMLRYCGIPARYVEGYVVTPSQAEALSSGETLTLTDANAHAWAEYYLDGVGWLPFDATPGYSEILTFELPADGLPTEESCGSIQKQKEEQKEPPIKKPQVEEEKQKDSSRTFVREAVNVILMILLVVLVLAILRTVILRNKLRKRQKSFCGEDFRKACAGVLCYIQELVTAMDEKTQVHSVPEIADAVSAALDGLVEETALEQLMNEVWYSNHPIGQEQTAQAHKWLGMAEENWKRKVPALKKFKQKYITCKIL